MKLDPFQQQAIDFIEQGLSVLVSAPTGAGKTVIAEYVIKQCLKRREKVIYTAPIKALSNQKYRDFQELTGQPVGILTGDVVLNSSASILIMTTEIFRNKILEGKDSLKDFAWIIFDEIHFLDDQERGTVWEESLIFMPDHMRFLGLSATIPNIDELKQWLESIHPQPVKIIKENNRPVPLHFSYQCQNVIYEDWHQLKQKGFRVPQYPHLSGRRLPHHVHAHPNRLTSLIKKFEDQDLFPCIYFVFSRKRTEILAKELGTFDFLNEKEKEDIEHLFKELCRRFDLTDDEGALELKPLIERGIAYHHAGMLPTLKEVVERLFTSRLLKVIFTTETFALGINMPARTVVFDELRKFYGFSFNTLRTRDFYQMAGRAGRRGIDKEGFVVTRVNPHEISPEELHKIIFSVPEKVHSHFNASYATILNLYQRYGEKLYDIYPKTFYYFQVKKDQRQRGVYFLKAKLDILKELGYIHRKGQLSSKGIFASRVYGYEMVLSELYEQQELEKLSLTQLGVLVLACIFEPRKGTQKPVLHRSASDMEFKTKKIVRRIQRLEKDVGLRILTKECHFHLTPVLEAWLRHESFSSILKYTNVDEGEIVRYFRMTIQVLREIIIESMTSEFQDKVSRLIHLMNRDVIDSEKQLRS